MTTPITMIITVSLTDEERRLILKILEMQTKSHVERARVRKLIDGFKLAELTPKSDEDDASTAQTFEIDNNLRKIAEELCKNTAIQGSPFMQALLYDLGERFTAPKNT